MVHNKSQANQNRVYIIDFLNIFSDYREVIYKKENIDFHSVKYNNVTNDTLQFFNMFFTKYIQYTSLNITDDTKFIFVMKKLYCYDNVLATVLKSYQQYNIQFVIIENRYTNTLLERNKDDFLCQYFFYMMSKSNDCVLISNDKYRDKMTYLKYFNQGVTVTILQIINGAIKNASAQCQVKQDCLHILFSQHIHRQSIPKQRLITIV